MATLRTEYTMVYMSQGGKGGNGGKGHNGDPESGFVKPSAKTIVESGSPLGSKYDDKHHYCGDCHWHTCNCYTWKQDTSKN